MSVHLPPVFYTALSILICWALFAILCSLVNEAIVQLKAERGRFMKAYLEKQLFDRPNGVNWATLLYGHGSIDSLIRSSNKPLDVISPRLFAETLVDSVANAYLVKIHADNGSQSPRYNQPVMQRFYIATQMLVRSDIVNMLRQALASAELKTGWNGDAANCQTVYNQLVENIADWYTAMEGRLTIWYKKKTRQRLFILGCVLATLLNADSIQLFEHFNRDEQAREALLAYYRANAPSPEDPYGAAFRVTTDPSPATGRERPLAAARTKSDLQLLDSISGSAELPVGPAALRRSVYAGQSGLDWSAVFWKVIGILISGFAASVGAPYWFQILKKTAGTKPIK